MTHDIDSLIEDLAELAVDPDVDPEVGAALAYITLRLRKATTGTTDVHTSVAVKSDLRITDRKTGAYRALVKMLDTLDGWVESTKENHKAAEHQDEDLGDECWTRFGPGDIQEMINDAAREMGVAEPWSNGVIIRMLEHPSDDTAVINALTAALEGADGLPIPSPREYATRIDAGLKRRGYAIVSLS